MYHDGPAGFRHNDRSEKQTCVNPGLRPPRLRLDTDSGKLADNGGNTGDTSRPHYKVFIHEMHAFGLAAHAQIPTWQLLRPHIATLAKTMPNSDFPTDMCAMLRCRDLARCALLGLHRGPLAASSTNSTTLEQLEATFKKYVGNFESQLEHMHDTMDKYTEKVEETLTQYKRWRYDIEKEHQALKAM